MSISIGIGLAEFPFADGAGFWRWVDLCEQGGIDSIWQTDRIVSRTPVLESMTAMAALAGRTRRLKFGMNVVSLAFRDPVLLAKQCATVDVLSEGRLLPAFGIGNPLAPEWAAMGLDTGTRGRRTDEALEIIHRLWHEDKVDFDGRFNQLRGASILPRPVQAELPMWIGGASEAAIRRTARFGTGWQAGGEPPAEAGRIADAIREAVVQAGRRIDDDHYGAGFPFLIGDAGDAAAQAAMDAYAKRTKRDPRAYFAVGDAATVLARLDEYISAGISKFILRPLGADSEAVMAQTRALIAQVLPRAPKQPPVRRG
jgi:probable F420-dependent oxidoreductase